MEAVNNSDFAIGQFRFLRSLMLVHGRYSYRRFSTLCCFMFFKNIALVMALYWYALAAAGSAIQVLPLFFVTCNPNPTLTLTLTLTLPFPSLTG